MDNDNTFGGQDKTKPVAPKTNPNDPNPKKAKPPRPRTVPIYNGQKPDIAEI